MICKRCGNTLSDTATLCLACGTVYGASKTEESSLRENGSYAFFPQHRVPPVGNIPFMRAQMFGVPFQLSNDGNALVVEILLSLFGIFGVGWLLSGRPVTGIVLLLCSIFLYWPFMIVATILTLGIGLIFLGPFAIFCIIMNAFLLAVRIKRRAAHIIMMQHSQRMPPMR